MDKSQPYDEPLDPHWEALNASSPTVFEMLHPNAAGLSEAGIEDLKGLRDDLDAQLEVMLETDKTPGWKRRETNVQNMIPFMTRRARAAEMMDNLNLAIGDGHLSNFPNLEGVKILFSVFAERSEELNFHKPKGERRISGGTPSERDDLLDIFHLAWVALREMESEGFPLVNYASTRA